jgi:hypothetical protein
MRQKTTLELFLLSVGRAYNGSRQTADEEAKKLFKEKGGTVDREKARETHLVFKGHKLIYINELDYWFVY